MGLEPGDSSEKALDHLQRLLDTVTMAGITAQTAEAVEEADMLLEVGRLTKEAIVCHEAKDFAGARDLMDRIGPLMELVYEGLTRRRDQ